MDRAVATNAAEPRSADLRSVDPVWERIREAAQLAAAAEPVLAGTLHATILSQPRFETRASAIIWLGSSARPRFPPP